MTLRQEKINKQLLKLLKNTFSYELSNLSLQDVEVSAVEISRDLSHCVVYYMCEANSYDIKKALETVIPFLRKKISSLKLRKVPTIVFKYDSSEKDFKKINDILSSIEYSKQDEEELFENYNLKDEFE